MLRACLSPDYPLGGAFVKGLHHRRRAESRDPLVHRLAGSHARSRRRALRLRPHLADTGLVVIQLGVGVDLVETRVFEGPL